MVEEVRDEEIEPTGAPEITPDMVQTALKALEAEGMVHYMSGGAYVPTERGWRLLKAFKPVKEEIIAYGHSNISATHTTTLEITKSDTLGEEADCIIGVRANKACKDLEKEFKDTLKDGRKVEITIEAEEITDKIIAYGSPALELTHPEDIVIRKSDFIDDRTLVILADKAACNLKKELVEKLKNPKVEIKITLEIKP